MRFTYLIAALAGFAAAVPGLFVDTVNTDVAAAGLQGRDIALEQAAEAMFANLTASRVAGGGIEDDEDQFIQCFPQGWELLTASCFRLREGISYLRGLDGKNRACSSPMKKQERVSCSWGAGIFVHSLVDYDQNIRCGEVGDLAEIVLRTCGGDVCMTDMKKPGKCINGFIIKPTFAVIVSLQNC